jgi:hypothetical protein
MKLIQPLDLGYIKCVFFTFTDNNNMKTLSYDEIKPVKGVEVIGNSTAATEFVAPLARVGARFFPSAPYFGEEGD